MSKWGNFGRLSKDWKRIHPQAHREFEFEISWCLHFQCCSTFQFKILSSWWHREGKTYKGLGLKRLLIKLYVTMKSNMIKQEMNLLSLWRHSGKNVRMSNAWAYCSIFNEYFATWPKIISLWQRVTVIPSSIAICQWQNWVKSD